MLSEEAAVANAEYTYYASPNSLVYNNATYLEDLGEDTIASLFRKTEGAVHDQDIAVKTLSGFPFSSALHQSANPLHRITN